MKIIYHCYGGSHSSVTAAGIHLGLLPMDSIPNRVQLEAVPYFDEQVNSDHGNLRFMGIDEFGNEIYVIGRRNAFREFQRLVAGFSEALEFSGEVCLYNCMPYVNWKMVLGGFTSRRLGWVTIGRPIVVEGVRFSYLKIVSLVQNVKVQVASNRKVMRQ